ncbi:50S ribosomal protein L36 [Streptomyces albogriseolus]
MSPSSPSCARRATSAAFSTCACRRGRVVVVNRANPQWKSRQG